MATVLDMIDNIKAIDLKSIARTVMQKNADVFTEFNRQQMMEGKRKDGKNIGDSPGRRGYYQSLMYARDKQKKNSKAGFMNPDLYLTGAFQDSMYMNVKGEDIVMDSTDSKAADLLKDYGGTIYGLNEEKKPEFVEVIMPEFHEVIEKQTGLKFN